MAEYVTRSGGERATFATGMVRDTSAGKTRYDLLFPLEAENPMLVRWAELLTRGAQHYSERNWEVAETEEELARFKESAIRHFIHWFIGLEEEDEAAAVYFNIQGAELVKEKLRGRRTKDVQKMQEG